MFPPRQSRFVSASFRPCTCPPRRARPRLEDLEDRLAPATFTVTNGNDSGPGSLRQAILSANALLGPDTIAFDIATPAVQTINPTSALPTVTGQLRIDGTTEPGYVGTPLVTLNGTAAGSSVNGLNLLAGGSVVRGLIVNRFSGDGIRVQAAGCVVSNCFIGTNAAGNIAAANGGYGVRVTGAGNRIGGTGPADLNVISGNGKAGVVLFGSGARNNQVLGNAIGVRADGSAAVPNLLGVWVTGGATGNVIGGAAPNTISGNTSTGVAFTGLGTTGNTVSNNRIGTDPSGAVVRPNGGDGLFIAAAARSSTVANNLISGNASNGVSITGAGVTGNRVFGNKVGTNAAGTAALPNGQNGIRIGEGAAGNLLGGLTAAARNLISGNTREGVDIEGAGTAGNMVEGNFIGTDVNGTFPLANLDGVTIARSAANNVIGGAVAGARNVISGNSGEGVLIDTFVVGTKVQGNFIGTDVHGTADLGNVLRGVHIFQRCDNNLVGGTVALARNVISGNNSDGVEIDTGATGNLVQGNFIGTDRTGTLDLGNSGRGVAVANNAANTTIGGTVAGARNVISGNDSDGALIDGAPSNKVLGNFIGTDLTGTLDLGNSGNGVLLARDSSSTIGGTVAGARNVISGNDLKGVLIDEFSTGEVVQGNFIGTDVTGTHDLGNTGDGVSILGRFTNNNNTVGGTVPGARNIISGNGQDGVHIFGGGARGNKVQGNFIGTDVTGTQDLGNSFEGVSIGGGATDNTIGGTVAAARNIISGNDRYGVMISDSGTAGALVQGNFIGVAADGVAALGNFSHGVFITGAAAFNTIGARFSTSAEAGAGNVIAHNGGNGVLVGSDPGAGFTTAAGNGNAILGNSIFANNGLGINLGPNDGVTPNDAGDGDSGPNNLLNFPVLNPALLLGDVLFLSGSINTQANKLVRIEFFASPVADLSGNGEGQRFLGFVVVQMGAGTTANFSLALKVAGLQPGQAITATATADFGTSEFSAAVLIS